MKSLDGMEKGSQHPPWRQGFHHPLGEGGGSENDTFHPLFWVESIILTKHGTIDSSKIFSRPTKHERGNSLLR